MDTCDVQDLCDCDNCHHARLLAAWAVLIEDKRMDVRISARILMGRREREIREGGELPLQPLEMQALQVCCDFIKEKPEGLRYLDRVVGVSGTPWR